MTTYSETLVNSYTASTQASSSAVALADGGWVVTWMSDGEDGSGGGVYQQRYDADGNIVGSETLVNTVTTSSQSAPSATALADGGWVVTWMSSGEDGSGGGLCHQRYDADGDAVGAETIVNTCTTGEQALSAVTALSDGGWVVTWQSDGQDGSAQGVYQQRYDANGGTIGAETLVNTTTDSFQYQPSVTALAGGGWVVGWQSYNQDGSGHGVYLQRYDADGNPLGDETQVNTYTANDQLEPCVTALADGGWVVTWTSFGQDGSGNGIYQQRYDADGDAVGSESVVNTHKGNYQQYSAVAALADGGWVVTWQSYYQDGAGYSIYQQRYDANGNAVGAEARVNTYATGDQDTASVTALADGGWLVTWSSYGQDGSDYGVYQQRYNADGGKVSITAPEGTDNTLTLPEDGSHAFSADDFGFSDKDGDTLDHVTIVGLPLKGTLTLNGEAVFAGDAIGADDIASLVWTPDADDNGNANASLTFSLTDSYGTTSKTNYTLTFDVTAVADASTGGDATLAVYEDHSYAFAAADFVFADKDGDTLDHVTIVGLPSKGVLTLNGAPISAGDEIGANDLDKLVWTPGENDNGDAAASFDFTLTDSDGTTSSASYTIRFDVAPVNDAPSGADRSVTVIEDHAYIFSEADFGFSDIEEDGFSSVVINIVPKAGSLMLDGVAVLAGAEIAVADLGDLVWTPAQNDQGEAIASLTFQVVDDGGTDHGGEDTERAAHTIAFDVTDVLDIFTGTSGRDKLTATSGADRLTGRGGNDRLAGGLGGDTFVFSGKFGKDTIADFDASGSDHDVVDLSGVKAITGWKDLAGHHMQQSDMDVVISDGHGNRIVLHDVWLKTLDAGDFAF